MHEYICFGNSLIFTFLGGSGDKHDRWWRGDGGCRLSEFKNSFRLRSPENFKKMMRARKIPTISGINIYINAQWKILAHSDTPQML